MAQAAAAQQVANMAADPFRYGWRYVRRTLAEGGEEVVQVPLSEDDVLHPEEDDFVIQSDMHSRVCSYLYNALRAHLASTSGAFVSCDLRIAWDNPALRAHGPDIMVIFGVAERQDRATFKVADEGARPALIIEVTSASTRRVDLTDKIDHYDRAGVPLYIIVDLFEREGQLRARLFGYHRAPAVYGPLAPDARGWLYLEPVGLWIGTEEPMAYLYDAQGERLEDYPEVIEALAETEQRAEQAEQRAEQAEQRAEQAEQRARDAAARAQAEARARAEAESRSQALEAELRRLRGDP